MTRRQTFVLTCCLSKKISNIIVRMIKMGWLYYYYSQQVCPFQYIFELFSRDLHLCLEWSRWHYGKLSSIQKKYSKSHHFRRSRLKILDGVELQFRVQVGPFNRTEYNRINDVASYEKKRFFWKCDDGLNEEKFQEVKRNIGISIMKQIYQLGLPNIVRTKIV